MKSERRLEAQRFRRGLEALEGREDEPYDHLRRGVLDEDGFQRQLNRIRAERAELARKLERANEELDDAWLVSAPALSELKEAPDWRTREDSNFRPSVP